MFFCFFFLLIDQFLTANRSGSVLGLRFHRKVEELAEHDVVRIIGGELFG